MEREKIERLFDKTIGENDFKEMIITQLYSWELCLQKKKLAEKTIERKIKNILDFYVFLNKSRGGDKNKRIRASEINNLCFEFIRDGLYNNDNIENEGVKEYRENIYFNVMGGMNYIFENYFDGIKEIIKPLTNEQKEVLEEVSKNKFYRCTSFNEEDKEDFYCSLQIKIIRDLGIKVYFDIEHKPYVFSHELGELIGKESKNVLRDIRKITDEIGQLKFEPSSQSTNFTMVEDVYINSQNKQQPTYRIYKDLMLKYILGMNGKKFGKFQLKYIDAFNYIEQEYNKLLIENSKLKESFYNMYNDIRKRNRDLLVVDFNKKKATKKKAS